MQMQRMGISEEPQAQRNERELHRQKPPLPTLASSLPAPMKSFEDELEKTDKWLSTSPKKDALQNKKSMSALMDFQTSEGSKDFVRFLPTSAPSILTHTFEHGQLEEMFQSILHDLNHEEELVSEATTSLATSQQNDQGQKSKKKKKNKKKKKKLKSKESTETLVHELESVEVAQQASCSEFWAAFHPDASPALISYFTAIVSSNQSFKLEKLEW
jgi:hypothetical protein